MCEKNYKEKDAKIQFMMLNKCTKCLSWAALQQTCWLLLHDIIFSVSAPNMHRSFERHQKLSNDAKHKKMPNKNFKELKPSCHLRCPLAVKSNSKKNQLE